MKCISFLLLLVFISCSTSKIIEKRGTVVLINEGPWKTNFKNMVFSNILYQMYGNEFVACCLSKDASGTANFDWLNYDTAYANKVPQVANEFIKRSYPEIEGKRVMMNYALEYRNSHELDSLTGVFYRQYQQDSLKAAEGNP